MSNNNKMNFQEQKIAEYLQKVKFKKRTFRGVDEEDVWKKIGELNELYEQSIVAERARYDALLKSHQEKCKAYCKAYIVKVLSEKGVAYGKKS